MKIHIVCLALSCITPFIDAISVLSINSLSSNSTFTGIQHLFKRKGKKTKSSPKTETRKKQLIVDDEMDYLNQQVQDNDIRSHYNIQLLDGNQEYLTTLNKALEYATGMFKGVHFEVEEWLQSKTYIPEYVRMVRASRRCESKCSKSDMLDVELDITRMIEKATSTRSIWFIYTIALKNLITFNTPHPAFYELFVSVFLEIDLVKVLEYINNFGLHQIRKVLVQKIAGLRLAGKIQSEIDPELFIHAKIILKLMDFLYRIIDIDILSTNFEESLAKAVDDSLELLELEHNFAEGNIIFDNAAGLLSKLQFIKIILPLVTGNKKFVEKLNEMRYIRPKMDAFKKDDSDAALKNTLKEFQRTMKPRFLTEWYQYYDMAQNLVSVYSSLDNVDEKIVNDDIHYKVNVYKDDMKKLLLLINSTLFLPNSRTFRFMNKTTTFKQEKKMHESEISHEAIEELFDYEQILDTPHQIALPNQHEVKTDSSTGHSKSKLRHYQAQTLHTLLNGDESTGLGELKWSDVSNWIITMGGYVERVGGSINMLFVPGEFAFPVRFDQPQPSDRLGIEKALVLRRIFEKWGISSSVE